MEVPEDRYILWEAEDEGLELPYACRMGCCTACAVKIVEGEMYQPESLGISAELREQGYGLMCVGYPLTDMVLQTVSEDEVYELQFGASFAQQVRLERAYACACNGRMTNRSQHPLWCISHRPSIPRTRIQSRETTTASA